MAEIVDLTEILECSYCHAPANEPCRTASGRIASRTHWDRLVDMDVSKHPPERNAIEFDLCDHWLDLRDHRCQNYWRHEVVLTDKVEVGGHVMFGTYGAGTWRFCNTHHRIFQRDRRDG